MTTRRLPGCRRCTTSPDDDNAVMEENGHIGYRCRDCNLVYVYPRPDRSQITNLYDHDAAHVSAQELIAASASRGKAMKARLTLREIRKYCPQGDLLEIGPGGGAFLRQAEKWGYRVHAAEFNPSQVAYLQSLGIDCRRGDFAQAFDGEVFDVIYHCDVLSHLVDPIAEFRAMRSLLKPGGVVVFETGNFGDLEQRYHRLVDRWQYPDHLYFFSRKSIANLANAAGFEARSMHEYSRSIEMRLDTLSKPIKRVLKRQRRVTSESPRAPNAASSKGDLKTRIRDLGMGTKHLIDHALIYHAGRFLPKTGRPQTVIVVFQRTSET